MKAVGGAAIEKLLSISSEPLALSPAEQPPFLGQYRLGAELLQLLQRKNGFYAFEAALHVFPISSRDCMSLEEWNSDSLWRAGYRDLAEGLLFFAEDILQNQFCLSVEGIVRFDSETGLRAPMAVTIEEWAEKVLANYLQETGWIFASKWQAQDGPIPAGKRLMPKTPFFLGGAHSLENLWLGDAVEGMRFKADLALQTRDLPDGAQIRLMVGKKPETQ